jgi:hypothetical protein
MQAASGNGSGPNQREIEAADMSEIIPGLYLVALQSIHLASFAKTLFDAREVGTLLLSIQSSYNSISNASSRFSSITQGNSSFFFAVRLEVTYSIKLP